MKVDAQDWIKVGSTPAFWLITVHVLFVVLTYVVSVPLSWSAFWPNFMFYQHYLSAIASGLFCLSVSTGMHIFLMVEAMLGIIALFSNAWYVAQAMQGNWEDNFTGEKEIPYTFTPKKIVVNAENLSSIDTGIALMSTEIGVTLAVLILQNLLLNVIIPVIIFGAAGSDTVNSEDRLDCNKHSAAYYVHAFFGISILAIGIAQGILSLYYATNGIILLTRTGNTLYLLLFFVAAGVMPPPPVAIDEQGRARTTSYINLITKQLKLKSGSYNTMYLIFYFMAWLLVGATISINATWSQTNNLGGYACPTLANVTLTMSGENVLNYNDVQYITYSNLTGSVSDSGYPARVDMTEKNIQAVTDFTCTEIWLNWIVLGLSLGMFLSNVYLAVVVNQG